MEQIPNRRNPPRFLVIVIGLTALMLVCTVVSIGLLGRDLLPRVIQELQPTLGPRSSGPSQSLSTILALADAEATRIDKNASLSSIIAGTPDDIYGVAYAGPTTGSLELDIAYYLPNGEALRVFLEDAAPRMTLSVSQISGGDGGAENYRLAKVSEPEFRQALASTKITPREAVQITWGRAHEEAKKQGLQNAKLNPVVAAFGMPIWEVYYGPSPSQQTGTQTSRNTDPVVVLGKPGDFGNHIAKYTVDLSTGQVTDLKSNSDSTQTPSSTP